MLSTKNQLCGICSHNRFVAHKKLDNGILILKCDRCGVGYRSDLFANSQPSPKDSCKSDAIHWLSAFSLLLQDGHPTNNVLHLALDGDNSNFATSNEEEIFQSIAEIFRATISGEGSAADLLFSVPLLPEPEDPILKMGPSRWYLSEFGVRYLIEDTFGRHLIGQPLKTTKHGSIYVGVATSNISRVAYLSAIASRVLNLNGQPMSDLERKARFEIHVLHGEQTQVHDLSQISHVFYSQSTSDSVSKISDLLIRISKTSADNATRASHLEAEISLIKSQLQSIKTSYAALANDAARNAAELTDEIVRLRSEIDRAKGKILTATEHKAGLAEKVSSPALITLKLLEKTGHRPEFFRNEPNPWPENRPLVSIIIPSFNYGNFVDEAIDSILAQTFDSIEIIVVEGGSSDATSRSHVANLDRSKIRVLMQGEGHRAGANRNYGISQALGKYICCLDADDKLKPTYIEKAIFLLERCEVDVVSSAQQCFGKESTIYHVEQRPHLEDLLERNNVLTCAVFRRELWRKAGGFRDSDKSITGYVYEDWSFWVRLAAFGARFFNMGQDPLLLYRVHGVSLSRGNDVLTLTDQRNLIKTINSDVINDQARELSYRLNSTALHSPGHFSHKDQSNAETRFKYTILLALPFLGLGGAERLISAIALHLSSLNVRVIIVTSIPIGPEIGSSVDWFEKSTCEIYNLPQFLPENLWDSFLHYLLAEKRVDLIWLAGSAFMYDNLRDIRMKYPNIAVVDLIFNTVGHTENNRRRRPQIDHVIVENNEVYSWLLKDGVRRDQITIIESGVDTNQISPDLRSFDLRQTILRGKEEYIVAFCGRWSVEKHPLFFIEIARQALGTLPLKFIMTGTGPLREQIRIAVDEALFPEGYFNLLGEVEDVLPYMASADIMIIPSILDGRPLAALEALACGTPVVASQVGGLPDIVQHGRTGWLCPPDDLVSFLNALSEATENRQKLELMRENARQFAEEFFNISQMCDKYEGVFSSEIIKKQ